MASDRGRVGMTGWWAATSKGGKANQPRHTWKRAWASLAGGDRRDKSGLLLQISAYFVRGAHASLDSSQNSFAAWLSHRIITRDCLNTRTGLGPCFVSENA